MNRPALPLAPWILAFSAACAWPAAAQRLFTQAGEELQYPEITVQGTNVVKRIKEASTGADKVINIPISQITRLDFPEPTDLQEAEAALLKGTADDVIAKCDSVLAIFTPFKVTPGSWYSAAALVKLEGLAMKGNADGYDRLRSDLKAINLSTDDQVRLGLVEASQDFYKGVTGPAKAAVLKLQSVSDNAAVLAKLYLLLGNIEYKREAYKEALDAYLHVPVFYGTQGEYLPSAELGAARSLMKMQRLEDARTYFQVVEDRYPNSPQAGMAKEDMKLVEKALGESGQEAIKAEEAKTEAESKKADAAEAKDAKKDEEKKPEESK